MVLTEGFCVFVLHMPLDDICSTYIQTLVSSKTYIGIRIGYYGYIDQVEVALTLEPTGCDYSTNTNDNGSSNTF